MPIPQRLNMLTWSESTLPLMTFGMPVAKIPCQKSVIFSCKGASEVTMRYIQFRAAPG